MSDDELSEYLAVAICCREWPVDPLSPMGRCGFCGERPTVRPWGHGRAPAVTAEEAAAVVAHEHQPTQG